LLLQEIGKPGATDALPNDQKINLHLQM